jgi:hypothetical protein
MAHERDVSEQERLDRIERHIKQLAEASTALKSELKLARQLAAKRAQAVRLHSTAAPRAKSTKKNR